jgi:hypothetical protein
MSRTGRIETPCVKGGTHSFLGLEDSAAETGLFANLVGNLSGDARERLSLERACASLLDGRESDLNMRFSGIRESLKDAGINALVAEGVALARGTGLPYLSRIEIEGGFTGGDPRFSVMTLQPLYESLSGGHFVFNQLSWQHEADDTDDGDPDNTINVGFAYRRLLLDETLLLGANVFFDHQTDQDHNRLSLGADAQTSLHGLAVNRYIPLTKWKGIDELYEARALAGWDLELSGRAPQYPDWTGYLRGFTWDAVDGADDIYGVDASLEWSPVPALVFTAGLTDENHADPDIRAAMRLRLNFHEPANLQFLPRPGLESVKSHVWDRVRRENTIRTQVRKRLSTALVVLETIGANKASTDEGALALSAGLAFNMPATVRVQDAPGAVARIRLADGGILTVGQGSRVKIEPGLLTLITGIMQYVSGGTNVIVNVPGGTITLLGTDIDAVTDGATSTVRVRDGSVRLKGSVSGAATVAAGGMAESVSGVVNAVAQGAPAFEAHTDAASEKIDRAAAPLSNAKAAPYPYEAPRITVPATSTGDTLVIGLRFTEAVTISGGTPRLTLTINGNDRTAALSGGSGTGDLAFSYTLQAGDAGASSLTVMGLDLNGATLTGGNKAAVTTIADAVLTLSGPVADTDPPAGYTAAWTTDPVDGGNETAAAFEIQNGEIGAAYDYTISSDGGGADVTGSGVVATATQAVAGIDVSGLGDGTLTLSVTLTDAALNTGAAATDTVTKDTGPASIPGLALWLDAADAPTITHSGGAVSQWADKSGGGNHAAQGAAASQPATGANTINGKNVITFDGSSDRMTLSPGIPPGSGYTVFSVVSIGDNAAQKAIIAGGNGALSVQTTSGEIPQLRRGSTLLLQASSGLPIGTPTIYSAKAFAATGTAIWLNGVPRGTSANDPALTDPVTEIGSRGGTQRYLGDVAEILIYTRDLSNAELKPTVCLYVTYAVVYTYGCDDGTIEPARCALIDAVLDGIGNQLRRLKPSIRGGYFLPGIWPRHSP